MSDMLKKYALQNDGHELCVTTQSVISFLRTKCSHSTTTPMATKIKGHTLPIVASNIIAIPPNRIADPINAMIVAGISGHQWILSVKRAVNTVIETQPTAKKSIKTPPSSTSIRVIVDAKGPSIARMPQLRLESQSQRNINAEIIRPIHKLGQE